MLLTNPQIKYKDSAGNWTTLPNLYACDINTSDRPGRTQEDVTGLYTDTSIDNIRIIFKKGSVTSVDNLQIKDVVELQVFDGSRIIQCTFNVATKYNIRKDSNTTNIVLTLSVINDIPQKIVSDATQISATWGKIGGDISDQSDLIDKFNAFPTKEEMNTELEKKLSKSGDTMTGNLSMSGHIVNMGGGRIANVGMGSSDDAVPRRYIDNNFALKTDVYTKSEVYSKTEADDKFATKETLTTELNKKENVGVCYTKEQTNTLLNNEINARTTEDTRLNGLISDLELSKASKTEVYTKTEVDTKLQEKVSYAGTGQSFKIGLDANGFYVED